LPQALERACSKEVAAAAASAALATNSSLTPSSSPLTVRQTSGDGGSGHSGSGSESSADVFNRLYSGTIRDFIRCRECGHARERRDKFMDLALVVADMRFAPDDGLTLFFDQPLLS
jgi:hypothetical protein